MAEQSIPAGYGPDSELDKEGPDPVWLQVTAILAARIEAERYQVHRPIPSIEQLTQEFGIARGTARKAAAFLAELGWVRIVNGRGVFVLPRD